MNYDTADGHREDRGKKSNLCRDREDIHRLDVLRLIDAGLRRNGADQQ